MREKLGEDHPDTLESMNNLAVTYVNVGEAAIALEMWRDSMRLAESSGNAEMPVGKTIASNIARLLSEHPELDN